MQYGEHHFQPDLLNEMRCDLCGEHVTFSQHVRTKARSPKGRLQQKSMHRFQDQSKAQAFWYLA